LIAQDDVPINNSTVPGRVKITQFPTRVPGLDEVLGGGLPEYSFNLIAGAPGSGKTTLFRIITGEEDADEGSIKIGPNVRMAYVSQARDQQLDPDRTIYEEISGGDDNFKIGQTSLSTRVYVAAFNFRGTTQNKLIGQLSGGERNRVQLAKMLKRGANVVLLDEPTNDLDVEVLRNLEHALLDFAGSAVVISHDRYFLDRICTNIIAFEGDSKVVYFKGNYSEYEQDRKQRLGTKYIEPNRIKFRKLETV